MYSKRPPAVLQLLICEDHSHNYALFLWGLHNWRELEELFNALANNTHAVKTHTHANAVHSHAVWPHAL